MDVTSNRSRIIVTCNSRLSPWLKQEIEELGFEPARVFKTGVELRGTINDCIRLNLNLRCASQVLYSLREFQANHPDHIYEQVKKFPWEVVIPAGGFFSVTCNVNHPSVNNELFVNVKVKDAIADRFREKTGKRPDSGPELDHVVIHLFWKEKYAELFLDTSGHTLSKHGYRKIPGKAPMLEALAAATILAGKWNRVSPFINPMCGSGTLAIEAALLAANRKPGLYRKNYSFMHIVGYDEVVYQNELRKLQNAIKVIPNLKIIATDISGDAVAISKVNAAHAGVENLIHFEQCDFEQTPIPEGEGGVVFFNPEYGERLGEQAKLEGTYKRIGDFLKQKCRGYTGYIFTGNPELAKKIGLRTSRRIEFYSAKLDCRLLEYELYEGSMRNRKSN
ncbi:MAG: class I SAM-dependent RNA methyltransferase [Flammeovirgaceae bacterium]|nr:MAG: class I SAM-dependent RNA methyltransferase [Flammeovirgaceae bacterium]